MEGFHVEFPADLTGKTRWMRRPSMMMKCWTRTLNAVLCGLLGSAPDSFPDDLHAYITEPHSRAHVLLEGAC